MRTERARGFWPLTFFFGAFVLFLYGPMLTIVVLSFQGPEGGLTFPMNGLSLHWFRKLFEGLGVIDIWAAFGRSFKLGLLVSLITVVLSLLAGLAYRKGFRGAGPLFYVTISSLIVPSIVVSLGIALQFRLIDTALKTIFEQFGLDALAESFATSMGLYVSGLGAHLTWTLPFGLLIMFAIFNRFDPRFEEAGRDLGATAWQNFWHVLLPLIGPSVVGVALFGFTLSWDEIARSSQAIGDLNTLPLELQGLTTTVTNPSIYALGTVTTGVSILVIALSMGTIALLRRRARLKAV